MLKKMICILMTSIMLVSALGVCSVSANTVSSESINEQQGIVSTLGIIDIDTMTANTVLTRSQFAKYLWEALKLEKTETPQNVFKDVDATHEVSYLAKYGYFEGNDGNFYPEREMTITEAYTAAARVLGYGMRANAEGGTEASYSLIAKRAGLTDDVNVNEGLTAANAAVILGNMLTSPVIFHVPQEDEVITSELEDLMSVDKVTGIVDNNKFIISIYGFNDGSPFASTAVIYDAEYSRPTVKRVPYVINDISRVLMPDKETHATALNALSSYDDSTEKVMIQDYVYLEISEGNEVKVNAEDVENYLSAGDIILYGNQAYTNQNPNHVYRYIRLLYDYSEDKTFWATDVEPHKYDFSNTSGYRYSFGYVDYLYIDHTFLNTSASTTIIKISDYNHNVQEIAAPQTSWSRITCFDASRRDFDMAFRAVPGDIVDYKTGGDDASKIFTVWDSSRAMGIVIYK